LFFYASFHMSNCKLFNLQQYGFLDVVQSAPNFPFLHHLIKHWLEWKLKMFVISQILIDLCLSKLHGFQLFSNCFAFLKDQIHPYFQIHWFHWLLFFVSFSRGISHRTPFESIRFVGFILWILFDQYFSCAVWLVSRNTSYFCEIQWHFLSDM